MDLTEKLRAQFAEEQPDCGDARSVLEMIYNYYHEHNRMDTEEVKRDFDELYQRMNGMSLREMDRIVDAVCVLCNDHRRSGFEDGVKIGFLLCRELNNE